MTTPLLLSAQVVLPHGGSAVADSGLLASPFRQAVVIEEVRWSTRNLCSGLSGSTPPQANWNMGALVRTKLNIGRVDLTNGFVPIWLFGTAMQVPGFVEAVSETTTFNGLGQIEVFSHYRWILPKPLYLAPGNALQSSFQHTDSDSHIGDTTVEVSYAGRYAAAADNPGSKWDVPWVTAWLPPPNQLYYQSSEKDLVNPFLVPLNVQRMVFRAFVNGTFGAYEPTDYLIQEEEAGLTIPNNIPARVVIKDSHGVNVIRNPADPSVVFDMPRRAWTFQTVLNPKERYNVTFMDTPNYAGYPGFANLHLSMVGWRTEKVAQ